MDLPKIISDSVEDPESTLSTLRQDISQRFNPSTVPDMPDPEKF